MDIGTTAEFYTTVSPDHMTQARWVIEAITVGRAETSDAEVTPGGKTSQIRRAG